jgi:translation initiation factor eIF-2B subunit gamma
VQPPLEQIGMAEFQAVILAGGAGVRLYPLTDETPKSLLLLNGKPLLYYQLTLLENSGFSDVLVITAKGDMYERVKEYVSRQYDGKNIAVEVVAVDEEAVETADALRYVADKIRSDFMVVAGDVITDCVLQNVADLHRINDASVTMLLKQEVVASLDSVMAPTKGGGGAKKEKPRRDEEMIDCIGMVDAESRVVFIAQSVYENEELNVPRALLKCRPRITMHTNLYDAHVYIFSHWVLDLLNKKKHIASIKADLIPHLVRRQFRGRQALPESVRDKLLSKQHLAHTLSVSQPLSSSDEDDSLKVFAYILPQNAY